MQLFPLSPPSALKASSFSLIAEQVLVQSKMAEKSVKNVLTEERINEALRDETKTVSKKLLVEFSKCNEAVGSGAVEALTEILKLDEKDITGDKVVFILGKSAANAAKEYALDAAKNAAMSELGLDVIKKEIVSQIAVQLGVSALDPTLISAFCVIARIYWASLSPEEKELFKQITVDMFLQRHVGQVMDPVFERVMSGKGRLQDYGAMGCLIQ